LHTEWDYTSNARQFDHQSGVVLEAFQCRAWAKFNGSTAALIAGKNVSGVVRNSAGNYTVSFTNAMPDTDYAAVANSNASATGAERAQVVGQATGSCNVVNLAGTTYTDATVVEVIVFR
jgi:hypothetical protein